LLLLICGSLGVVLYLNMHASPSFGWGVIPANAIREARERDYFFVLSFWAWGLWAGYGAITVTQRLRVRPIFGVLMAALPLALNWGAVTRRRQPEASLPRQLGESLLRSAPQYAVLFVDGDNDTYPLWFLQQVDALRPDVTVVTVPLLGADWYAAELARRHQLLPPGGRSEVPEGTSLPTAIADHARGLGRPVVASISLDRGTRRQIGRAWRLSGLVYVEEPLQATDNSGGPQRTEFFLDTAATKALAQRIDRWLADRSIRRSTDSMDDYALGLLQCPRLSLAPSLTAAQGDSLASLCNRR
jgi:hypothetical protein